jgi:tetratricopeptide (TPR) repeat protein
MIADFKEETRTVLSQVGEATGNFRNIDRLDSVGKLPTPVSESVGLLAHRARDFRSKVGYETALREYRTETEMVDALSAVDEITRSIASNDASAANAKLADFLKNNPEASADSLKPVWQYLSSMRQLCSRLEKDADIHLQRAESLAAASRTSEAIREYQEAYRIFPNPATAEKIRQLQANSLGL